MATQSLEERTVDLARLAEILQEKTIDPAVLAYFGKRMAGTKEMEILRIVIADPKTPEDTLKMLAATEGGKVLEAILLNEDRLIQTPVLLDVLKSNPEISIRQKTRIDEIEKHLIRGNIPAPTPEATPPPVVPVPEVQVGLRIINICLVWRMANGCIIPMMWKRKSRLWLMAVTVMYGAGRQWGCTIFTAQS